jgi:surface antigen
MFLPFSTQDEEDKVMNIQTGITRLQAMERLVIVAFISSLFFLQGCETTSHAQEGEIIGAVIGGVIGAQIDDGDTRTAAIIIGTIAGSMIGRHIGQSMDDTDRMMTARSLNDSRTGEPTSWVNPDTGYRYTVTPTRTYEESGGPCREFQLDATVGGQTDQDVYGIACLQADGSWLVQ